MISAVVQKDRTGCGIAAAAAIARVSYAHAKAVAASAGVSVADSRLWSTTGPVRRLLARLGWRVSARPRNFRRWDALPDCALLAIKWHLVQGRPHWHWVVFVRQAGEGYVLDSKRGLKHSVRRDFGRMTPKRYMAVSRKPGTQ